MTPEEQILSLLDFLRERKKGDALPQHIPETDDDWDAWTVSAAQQGIASLLYFRLKQTEIESTIPSRVFHELRQQYHQNAARNLRLLHELNNITKTLNEQEIPVMPLKGAFLAFHVYENPALRVMSDIDILIPLPKVKHAVNILNQLRYETMGNPWEEAAHHIVLFHEKGFFPIEVHWEFGTIANDPVFPADLLWSRASQKEDMGANILAISPEDLLIHICQHAAIAHLFAQGIRALCDVDLLIRKNHQTLDWTYISSQSSAWKLNNAIALILRLCKQFLHTPLPEDATKLLPIKLLDPRIIIDEAIHQISLTTEGLNPETDIFSIKVLTRILSERKPSAMLTLLSKSIFRPAHIPMEIFSVSNKSLFYTNRLQYLIKKYAKYAWQRFFTNQPISQETKRQKELLKWLRS
jgi:hypothetical protein